MAHISENGSEKKMAEGGNDAELLKEKANKYFKGNFWNLSSQCVFSVFFYNLTLWPLVSSGVIVLQYTSSKAGRKY